ncbi:MAG: hypothetical protein GY943_08555 [Chloroflexi bacterium]|nr:hypothetical protein [Chloroflexota bacterium]
MNRLLVVYFALLLTLLGCQSAAELPSTGDDVPIVLEQPVTEIPLAGPVSAADAEVSGMTWYGDWLILLPQYPSVVEDSLYALAKADILAVLDGQQAGPITPQPIPFDTSAIESLPNFEGVEAIAFNGEDVYITIETDQGSTMAGYLIGGRIEPDLSALTVTTSPTIPIPAQTEIDNYSEESVLFFDEMVMTLYEANGSLINDAPQVHRFDALLNELEAVSFPNIEYRITDVTDVDGNGRFWAINYIFEGSIDKLNPAPDPLVAQYGIGTTHAENNTVERLVEFQYTNEGVDFTDNAPIQLTLLSDGTARNWEGIVRLDDRGFLLITDKFPDTILAFVPSP